MKDWGYRDEGDYFENELLVGGTHPMHTPHARVGEGRCSRKEYRHYMMMRV